MLKKLLLIGIIGTQLCAICMIADDVQLSGDAVQGSSMAIQTDSVEKESPISSSDSTLSDEPRPVTPNFNTLDFRLQKMFISIFVDFIFKYYGYN
jgi:hypothetical protein